ncbi:MAG: hypothetical protein DLM71_02930 [Chloroflexi bacterium]|nr:MAG: hypothetical protein DLM71_02930 [Chloroflexota bacterium]
MFERARRRLAARYVGVFALVLVGFSVALIGIAALVLRPGFDLVPEPTSEQAARHAYASTIGAIILALVLADGIVIIAVSLVAYHLAGRTLRPIQQALDRQRRFVADASHEMRNPLAAIRSTAESALQAGIGADQRGVALQRIVDASERLSVLTDDLLLMARSERGLLDPVLEPVDLSLVAAEAVQELRALRPDSLVTPNLTPDLLVRADEQQLTRIIGNLLDNAIRHGGGGTVELRTRELNGEATLEVIDHGPGIAESDLERIFEPFYRVRPRDGAAKGTGLGLAIGAELARRNGGRLTAVSRPGAGATFRLQLPRFR